MLTYYFGLFLVNDLDGKVVLEQLTNLMNIQIVVRKLQGFESPYISLMRAEENQKIQVIKFAHLAPIHVLS